MTIIFSVFIHRRVWKPAAAFGPRPGRLGEEILQPRQQGECRMRLAVQIVIVVCCLCDVDMKWTGHWLTAISQIVIPLINETRWIWALATPPLTLIGTSRARLLNSPLSESRVGLSFMMMKPFFPPYPLKARLQQINIFGKIEGGAEWVFGSFRCPPLGGASFWLPDQLFDSGLDSGNPFAHLCFLLYSLFYGNYFPLT